MRENKLRLTKSLCLRVCVMENTVLENALELAHLVSFLTPSYGDRLVITLSIRFLLPHQYLKVRFSLSP